MTHLFRIIADESGGKCACLIEQPSCERCAPTYLEREHKLAETISETAPLDVITLCARCTREYVSGEPDGKLKTLGFWALRAVAMVTAFVAALMLGGMLGFSGVLLLLRHLPL